MTLSYNCFFELLPDERAGLVLLTNASEEEPLMELLAFLYDQLLGRPHRGPVPVPALEPYTDGEETARWPLYEGAYLNVEWGAMVEVRRSGAELLLDREGEELALTAIAPGRYVAALPSGSRLPVAFLDNGVTRPTAGLAGEPYQRFSWPIFMAWRLSPAATATRTTQTPPRCSIWKSWMAVCVCARATVRR